MKQMPRVMTLATCVLAIHVPGWASADRGSVEEAVSLVRRAADYLKENGTNKAYAAFSDPADQFKDRDLYVFVIDLNGKVHAHGANPKLIIALTWPRNGTAFGARLRSSLSDPHSSDS